MKERALREGVTVLQHNDKLEDGTKVMTTTIKVTTEVNGILREFIMLFNRRVELGNNPEGGNINLRQHTGVHKAIKKEVARVLSETGDLDKAVSISTTVLDMIDNKYRTSKTPYIGKQGVYSQYRSSSIQ